jgi:LmbE family N-acetylglucosaminyl deacetylase
MPDDSPDTVLLDDPAGIERILIVAAHPDDVDFGAAGSVAVWTALGIEVAYCIVTDGDAGGSDRAISRADIPALRREEQVAAAAEVGVTEVRFLGYPDGRLVASMELRRDLSREIRRFRPQRVVCPSPERSWEPINVSHPDHLAAGEATVCAVYPDARNPFSHPELLEEGLEPYTVPQLWLAAHPRRNRVVDVTDTFQRKLAALRCHRSQVGDGEWLEQRIGEFQAGIAQEAGLPEGRLAEAFYSAGIF